MDDSKLLKPYRDVSQFENFLGNPFAEEAIINFRQSVALDEKEEFPAKQVESLDQWGLSRYFVPKNLGGKLDHLEETHGLIRALSKRDLTVAIGKCKTLLGSLPVWIAGTEVQKNSLAKLVIKGGDVSLALSEREHGADLLASETYAQINEDKTYALNGEKWLINNATRASAWCVLARTSHHAHARALSLFLIFKKEDLEKNPRVLSKIKTHGVRGADISGLGFENLKIENNELLGKEGHGLEQTLKTLQVSRTLCTALSLGSAECAFTLAYRFARERVLYDGPMLNLPEVKNEFVDVMVALWTCDALARGAVRALHFLPQETSYLSAIAKYFVPEQIENLIRRLSVLLGARHYLREEFASGAFQKLVRDHSLVPLFDGSGPVNLAVIRSQLSRVVETASSAEGAQDCFNDAEIPQAYDFSHYKFSASGAESWLGVFQHYREHAIPLVGRMAEAYLKKYQDENSKILGSEKISVKFAENRCWLHAAAAAFFSFNEHFQESELGLAWLILSLHQTSQVLQLDLNLEAEQMGFARELISAEIETRAPFQYGIINLGSL